jgi:nitrogen regulatory protein PII
MAASLQNVFLVTVICESVLQDRIVKLLKNAGASGYTITQAIGSGRHGSRMGDIAGFNTNIEIKVLTSEEICDRLMAEMKPIQEKHALIAFRQSVEALL